MKNKYIRLPLKGTYNTRELGGFVSSDKQITAFGRFLRSDRLDGLKDEDIKFLKAYGLTTVIDLRSKSECQMMEDQPIIKAGLNYRHLPLMREEDYLKAMEDPKTYSAAANDYIGIIENKEAICQVFKVLSQSAGCVLFHCTGGQDRTGVVAMLLLGLMNIPRNDIINDYIITGTYISQDHRYDEFLPANMTAMPRITQASTMINTYDYLTSRYGSIEDYLMDCGISMDELSSIKKSFMDNEGDEVRRLVLDHSFNCRELGGLPLNEGISAYHQFLRADDIAHLSDKDLDELAAYGIKTVIDLRMPMEAQNAPDAVVHDQRFIYRHFSYMGDDFANTGGDVSRLNPETYAGLRLEDIYLTLIANEEKTGQLLKLISDSEKGGILFHCSAGKDRTGVLAMLLLMIAHAKREDILANYQPSYYNLMANPKIREAQEKYKLSLMSSDASTIAKVYDYIIDEYHDIESYLKACDLTDDDISKIYDRLVDKD